MSPVAHAGAEELMEAFEVSSREVLEVILATSGTVAETLNEAAKKLHAIFGAGVRIQLTVRTDPDSPGHAPIVAVIHSTGDVADAIERLEQFDRDWWLGASVKESAEICFLVDPQ